MNGKKIIAATMLGMMAFGGAINVSATEGSADAPGHAPQKKESKVNLIVKEEKVVILKSGLDDMKIELTKKHDSTVLTGSTKGNDIGSVKVYATKGQNWTVKASLKDKALYLSQHREADVDPAKAPHQKTVDVQSLVVTSKLRKLVELAPQTGGANVIFSSKTPGVEQNKSKEHSLKFTKADIRVNDKKNVIDEKTKLSGTIEYVLSNVAHHN